MHRLGALFRVLALASLLVTNTGRANDTPGTAGPSPEPQGMFGPLRTESGAPALERATRGPRGCAILLFGLAVLAAPTVITGAHVLHGVTLVADAYKALPAFRTHRDAEAAATLQQALGDKEHALETVGGPVTVRFDGRRLQWNDRGQPGQIALHGAVQEWAYPNGSRTLSYTDYPPDLARNPEQSYYGFTIRLAPDGTVSSFEVDVHEPTKKLRINNRTETVTWYTDHEPRRVLEAAAPR